MGTVPRVARAALHFFEEPPVSGSCGSGAVFFCGCNLQCVYCQNAAISRANVGKMCDEQQLVEIFDKLEEQGAHNINLVTAGHFSPAVARALKIKKRGVPVIYNCGGYESIETLKMLEGLIDVYLPDYKYGIANVAEKYSDAADYPAVAGAAIEEMFSQVGEPVINNGLIKKGLIVRHLVLPKNRENTRAALDFVAALPKGVCLSLMAQFTPVVGEGELSRRITQREYDHACEYALNLGLTNVFVQQLSSAEEEYIPNWDML